MSDLRAQNIMNLGRLAANVGNTLLRQEGARQLSTAQADVTTAYGNFLRDLENDPDPTGYVGRLAEFKSGEVMTSIDDAVSNPYAKRSYEESMKQTHANMEQRVLDMASVNSERFGREQIITDVQNIRNEPRFPKTSYVDWLTNRENATLMTIVRGEEAGLYDPDEAAKMKRENLATLHSAYSKDMAIEAARTMLDGGASAGEVLDSIEKTIRTGEVTSEIPMFQDMGAAYGHINLSPEAKDELIKDVRAEVNSLSTRLEQRRVAAAAGEEQSIVEAFYSSDWVSLSNNDYEAIKNMPNMTTERKTYYMGLVGARANKEQIKTDQLQVADEHREQLQEFDIELEDFQAAVEPGTLPEGVDAFEKKIESDDELSAAERRYYTSGIELLKAEAAKVSEAEEAEEDRLPYLRHIHEYDRVIKDYNITPYDTLNIEAVIQTLDDLYADDIMIPHEQDREERARELERLVGDYYDTTGKTPSPEDASRIFKAFYEDKVSDEELRDIIMSWEAQGGKVSTAQTWMGRIKDRWKYQQDTNVVTAVDLLDRFFKYQYYEGMPAKESLRVSSNQRDAEEQVRALLDSDQYRKASQTDREMLMDSTLRGITLDPRSGLMKIGGVAQASPERLAERVANNAPTEEVERITSQIYREWWPEYVSDNIGPAAVVPALLGDTFVLFHEESNTVFTQVRTPLGAYRWQIGEYTGSNQVDWERDINRGRELKKEYE